MKTDDDNICGNALLQVTQSECVPHFIPLSITSTIINKYYGKCKVNFTSESLWETFHDQGVIDTDIKNQYIIEQMIFIQINTNGDYIEIVYNMVSCKLKVMRLKDCTIHVFPIR